MPLISTRLRNTGAKAPGAKRERALSRPESIATRLIRPRYGNVIRLLPALTIADDELDEGLGLLEGALAAAA